MNESTGHTICHCGRTQVTKKTPAEYLPDVALQQSPMLLGLHCQFPCNPMPFWHQWCCPGPITPVHVSPRPCLGLFGMVGTKRFYSSAECEWSTCVTRGQVQALAVLHLLADKQTPHQYPSPHCYPPLPPPPNPPQCVFLTVSTLTQPVPSRKAH